MSIQMHDVVRKREKAYRDAKGLFVGEVRLTRMGRVEMDLVDGEGNTFTVELEPVGVPVFKKGKGRKVGVLAGAGTGTSTGTGTSINTSTGTNTEADTGEGTKE